MESTFNNQENRRKALDSYIGKLVAKPKKKEEKGQRIDNLHLHILLIEKDEGLRKVMAGCISRFSAPATVMAVPSIKDAIELINNNTKFDRIIVDGNPKKEDLTVHDLLRTNKDFRQDGRVIVVYNSNAEARSSEFNRIEEIRTQTFMHEITKDIENSILDEPKYAEVVHVDCKARISREQGREYIRDPVRAVRAKLKLLIRIKRKKFMELKQRMEDGRNSLGKDKDETLE